MVIRMSAGDLNAWVALIGFVLGVGTGAFALKNGFSLGRAHETNKESGAVLPVLMLGILILATCSTLLKASEAGPGSLHAPIIMSLIGGLIFGALAQKSRMCFAGGIRDAILMKNFDLLTIIAGLFVVMLIFNLATGRFVLGFNTPGIIAHSNHLWNILGMYAVGFAAVLAGGCPLRQLILAGQGSSDSAVTVLGMFFAAALCKRNSYECRDRRTRCRSRNAEWKSCLHYLYYRMLYHCIYKQKRAGKIVRNRKI